MTTTSSREFDHDTSRAKAAARNGPVFITDRGRPAYVPLTIDAYRHLVGNGPSLAEALARSGENDRAFDPPRVCGLVKPAALD